MGRREGGKWEEGREEGGKGEVAWRKFILYRAPRERPISNVTRGQIDFPTV